jgi:hypothetical protein
MRAKGISYEKRVAKALVAAYSPTCEVIVAQWIEYEDRYGRAWRQPDCILVPTDASLPVVVIETKLSWQQDALRKLAEVYAPLIKALWPDRAVRTVQVCHNLPLGHEAALAPLTALLDGPFKDGYFLVHHCV